MYLGWPLPNPGCRVPADLGPITCLGDEEPTGIPEIGPLRIERIWDLAETALPFWGTSRDTDVHPP